MLAPLVEAFALPGIVERANLQKPHAEYVMTTIHDALAPRLAYVYISTRHLPFATSLTIPESCEVSTSQEVSVQ
ncbi:MAG: hypothetical protein K2G67_05005 [Muribaculaceae bacterium]|nr:hypothetical protein [Muribaculaceae bacterium]